MFSRYAERVVKIQVVETGSAAKATIGSGFFVSASGDVITNYHVISKLIHDPERYRAELIDVGGAVHPVTVQGVDVVHDLAVLMTEARPRAHFSLGPVTVAQGNRLYSLGHPEDLGLSIVEGTYNGHLPHTRHARIHFTGSLNPGMSGGPTIAHDGRVVGINVATAGNQLSFLVPVERAVALVERVVARGDDPPGRTLEDVGRQLRDHQEAYLRDMFAGETKTVRLGPYQLITEPAPFFRCWADATRRQELPYETVRHQCSTDDYLFIAGDQSTGVVDLEHEMLSTRKLNPAQFFSLYTSIFTTDNTPGGEEEHVTSWRCGTRNVRNALAADARRAVPAPLSKARRAVRRRAQGGRPRTQRLGARVHAHDVRRDVRERRPARAPLPGEDLVEMILEVVHPGGARTWHRLGDLPLTVGRGLTNDLILEDPYVDPHHARISLDEAGAPADRGSRQRQRAGRERLETSGASLAPAGRGGSRRTHDASLSRSRRAGRSGACRRSRHAGEHPRATAGGRGGASALEARAGDGDRLSLGEHQGGAAADRRRRHGRGRDLHLDG